MNSLFTFRPRRTAIANGGSWLIVFSNHRSLPESELWDTLARDIGSHLTPDAIIFVVRHNVLQNAAGQLSKLLKDQVSWRISLEETSVGILSYNESGQLESFQTAAGPEVKIDKSVYKTILHEGILQIFKKRDGFIRPSSTTHIVHPSGRHSQGFMRIANLMVSGPEVSFMAIGILPYLDGNVKNLWVDTSSISPIAHAAVLTRLLFIPEYEIPVVNSFASWRGLRDGLVTPQPDASFVLISASTSGRMAIEFMEDQGFAPDQVLTLFSRAEPNKDVKVLCDLTQGGGNSAEGGPLPVYEPEDCPLCKIGSTPVRFVGDQFLADEIKFQAVLPGIRDAPPQLRDFMKASYGWEALRMGVLTSEDAVNEYRIDVSKLIESPAFAEKLAYAGRRYIPASVKAVVALDDEASMILADRVLKGCCPDGTRGPIRASLLRDDPTESVEGAVVVLAAAIRSGGSLQSVSRDLRDSMDSHPRIFLVGLAKHGHLERHRHLKSDLAFNHGFPHTVQILHDLTLPTVSEASAWERELSILKDLVDPFSDGIAHESVRGPIEARIEEINGLASGAVRGFFWPATDGRPLQLRKTFAFWEPGYDPERASQGDVLFTIASVLESMRADVSNSLPKLVRTAFHHSLLSPATFGRYNDGIIQASFLRAAKSFELDYSGDPTTSAEMCRIVKKIVRDFDNRRGEAVIEFFIAIACQRLQFAPGDLSKVIDALPESAPEILKSLRDSCQALA